MATKAFYPVMKADLFDFLGLPPTICLLLKQISDNKRQMYWPDAFNPQPYVQKQQT